MAHPTFQRREGSSQDHVASQPVAGEASNVQLKQSLREMSFAEGEQAVSPASAVQMEAAPKTSTPAEQGTIHARVVQVTEASDARIPPGESWSTVIINAGKNQHITLESTVEIDGHRGQIVEVYPGRSQVRVKVSPIVLAGVSDVVVRNPAAQGKADAESRKRSDAEHQADQQSELGSRR